MIHRRGDGGMRLPQPQVNCKKGLAAPSQSRYSRTCEGLWGHIYDCMNSQQADQWNSTTREIAEYTTRECSQYRRDLSRAIMELEHPSLPVPANLPSNANDTPKVLFSQRIKQFVDPWGSNDPIWIQIGAQKIWLRWCHCFY